MTKRRQASIQPNLMVESSSQNQSILHLECPVQNYDWGIIGDQSLAAQIYNKNTGTPLKPNTPYAELWIGTHPNGPAHVKLSNGQKEELRRVLGKDLPFLFKILSVRKALSIQAHPDAELAHRLHHEFPSIYKDPNHKPEIAIALTPFEALCGFRPVEEIVTLALKYPEFGCLVSTESLMGLEAAQNHGTEVKKSALKAFFHDLMIAKPDLVKTKTGHLIARLEQPNELESLFIRINSEFPNEVGCFCIFVLNYVQMLPGECVFLAANEPHAYLRGECVECMALSDNVVRAGLTPKFRDVDTLCTMLTYNTYKGAEVFTQPSRLSPFSVEYKAPVKEFSVTKTQFEELGQSETVKRTTETIVLCLKGKLTIQSLTETVECQRGSILMLPAGQEISMKCNSEDGALLYQAYQPL